MAALRAAGQPVHLVDIAAGHGRYVLDALAGELQAGDSLLLRDYSDLNVDGGRALIAEKGLQAFARFEKGDAFDRASLAGLEPRPTLAVVSGLYELFPRTRWSAVRSPASADAVAPGGYLVYTGQPWHPQLELIARSLTSHRGLSAWVMRRRTQAEMDQLVDAAGFEKSRPAGRRMGHLHRVARPPEGCLRRLEPGSHRRHPGAAALGPAPILLLALLGPFFLRQLRLRHLVDQPAGRGAERGFRLGAPDPAVAVDDRALLVGRPLLRDLVFHLHHAATSCMTHAKRLLAAQVISVGFFLLLPLRFTFERPPIDGLFGGMFAALMQFDKPFNQAPSLHISLLLILWLRYAAHLGTPGRLLLHLWFALIGLSVLTTWQHHFIDLPTGFAGRRRVHRAFP